MSPGEACRGEMASQGERAGRVKDLATRESLAAEENWPERKFLRGTGATGALASGVDG